MAKKKTDETTPTPEPAPRNDDDQGGQPARGALSEAVRHALAALGPDAKIGEVRNHLAQHFPGLTYNENTLNTTVAKFRGKMKAGSSGPTRVGSSVQSFRPAPVVSDEPTLSDLFTVEKIAEENNLALTELLSQVHQVYDMASAVGSLDKLLKCAEALHRFTRK